MDLAFQEFGITPKIVCETQTIVSACQLVSYGIGITAVDPLLMTAIDLTNVKAVEWEIPIHIEYCLFRPISGSTSEFADKVASALHDVVKVLLGGSTGRIKRAANS
jgi:hypothetical protein